MVTISDYIPMVQKRGEQGSIHVEIQKMKNATFWTNKIAK